MWNYIMSTRSQEKTTKLSFLNFKEVSIDRFDITSILVLIIKFLSEEEKSKVQDDNDYVQELVRV
ncbi:hypothetical protein [uncultured Polaribacter sp.]|nr:hypothetical protein [uncultured Polaribacter sp.]